MRCPGTVQWFVAAVVVACGSVTPGLAQTPRARPAGRVSFHVNTAARDFEGGARRLDTELWTGITFQTPDTEDSGSEFGFDLRHSAYLDQTRPNRVSIYDGFVGMRFGTTPQVRVRGGHMWLSELGSVGALAGGLAELRLGGGGTTDRSHVRIGAFSGLEPVLYRTGYVPGVRKHGGYVAFERGFLRRHLVGYTRIQQGPILERSVLTVTNFVPAGRAVFVYQAAEFDLQGPANGMAARGLSYFLTNARVTPHARLELLGTYNRGRSIDARTLSEDIRRGQPLTPQAIDGLRYESAGGRVTVEVLPQVRLYAGYSRDRNNRDDMPTARITLGGHAGNVLGSGFDVSGSDAWIERSTGPYHSRYLSVGRSVGRSLYLSADYATSLAVVRFLRSDGIVIETRPSTRRVSGTASATIARLWSVLCTLDYSTDQAYKEWRILSGLSYRLR